MNNSEHRFLNDDKCKEKDDSGLLLGSYSLLFMLNLVKRFYFNFNRYNNITDIPDCDNSDSHPDFLKEGILEIQRLFQTAIAHTADYENLITDNTFNQEDIENTFQPIASLILIRQEITNALYELRHTLHQTSHPERFADILAVLDSIYFHFIDEDKSITINNIIDYFSSLLKLGDAEASS